MKVIGFANKFYTLWEVSSEDITNAANIKIGTKTNYWYIKNISFDYDTVIKLHPNTPIWEDLRGISKSFDTIKYSYPVDMISKGYYAGTLISSITDTRSLIWSYFNESDDRCVNIEAQLNSLGLFKYEQNGIDFLSKEEIDIRITKETNRINAINAMNAIFDKYSTEGEIEIYCHKNLSSYGWIVIDEINYKFKHFKELYYNGYNYGIPTKNGVGKKIKGKTLKASVQSAIDDEGYRYLLVSDFTIL